MAWEIFVFAVLVILQPQPAAGVGSFLHDLNLNQTQFFSKLLFFLPIYRCQRTSRTINCGPRMFGFQSLLLLPFKKSVVVCFVSSFFPAFRNLVGVTGVEPVTLRLSSACSNQLSYTPGWKTGARLDEPDCRSGDKGTRTPDL